MPSASGIRAIPQKKVKAIAAETMPRTRWTRIAARVGQPRRVANPHRCDQGEAERVAQEQRAVGASGQRRALHQPRPSARTGRPQPMSRYKAASDGRGAWDRSTASAVASNPRHGIQRTVSRAAWIAGLETEQNWPQFARQYGPRSGRPIERGGITMRLTLRTTLLAGLAAVVTAPVAAQGLQPQSVLDEDAAPGDLHPGGAGADAAARARLPGGHAMAGGACPHPARGGRSHRRAKASSPPTIVPREPARGDRGRCRAAARRSRRARPSPGWSRTCATGARRWRRAASGSSSITDADAIPTGKVMTEALATGDIAAALSTVLPTHPDYAALKAELAATPASDARGAAR